MLSSNEEYEFSVFRSVITPVFLFIVLLMVSLSFCACCKKTKKKRNAQAEMKEDYRRHRKRHSSERRRSSDDEDKKSEASKYGNRKYESEERRFRSYLSEVSESEVSEESVKRKKRDSDEKYKHHRHLKKSKRESDEHRRGSREKAKEKEHQHLEPARNSIPVEKRGGGLVEDQPKIVPERRSAPREVLVHKDVKVRSAPREVLPEKIIEPEVPRPQIIEEAKIAKPPSIKEPPTTIPMHQKEESIGYQIFSETVMKKVANLVAADPKGAHGVEKVAVGGQVPKGIVKNQRQFSGHVWQPPVSEAPRVDDPNKVYAGRKEYQTLFIVKDDVLQSSQYKKKS